MKKNQGISLLEVLVALIVLSVGLLGVASLQGLSKRANHEALQRTLATYMANEIIERMRGNSDVFQDGNGIYVTGPYDTGTDNALGGATISSEPSPSCESGTSCTTAELAEHDLWEWEQSIDGAYIQASGNNAGGLVEPEACILHDEGKIAVIITWDSLTNTTSGSSTNCGSATGANRRQMIVNTFI